MSRNLLTFPPFISISSHPINILSTETLSILTGCNFLVRLDLYTSLSQKLLTRVQCIQTSYLHYFFVYVRKYDHICFCFLRWCISVMFLCCFVFRLLHFDIPWYLLYSDFLSDDTPDTWYHNSLSFSRHRISKFKAMFSYSATKFYNMLLFSICSSSSFVLLCCYKICINALSIFTLIVSIFLY